VTDLCGSTLLPLDTRTGTGIEEGRIEVDDQRRRGSARGFNPDQQRRRPPRVGIDLSSAAGIVSESSVGKAAFELKRERTRECCDTRELRIAIRLFAVTIAIDVGRLSIDTIDIVTVLHCIFKRLKTLFRKL
jgi:hypothetical protein